jgi:hypothetical protein
MAAATAAPARGPPDERSLFCFDADKLGVEVDAAAKLFDAMVGAKAALLESADRDATAAAHLRYFASLLDTEGLDSSAFSASHRGNARRLCLSVRRLVEACKAGHLETAAVTRAHALTKWSAHPPLTSSRSELTALQRRPSLRWTAPSVLSTLTVQDVKEVALLLGSITSSIVEARFVGEPRLLVRLPPHAGIEDLWAGIDALSGACGAARARFAELGECLGVGKHGAEIRPQPWRIDDNSDDAVHVFSLAVLAIEAAEHLKRPAAIGPRTPDAAFSELRRLGLGLRLFSDLIDNAMLTLGGRVDALAHKLRAKVLWSAHAPTHKKFDSDWALPDFSRDGIDTVCVCFNELCDALFAHLELVRVVGKARTGELVDAASNHLSQGSWLSWGWPLWVALELADHDKESQAGAGERTQGLFFIQPVEHRVPFLLEAARGIADTLTAAPAMSSAEVLFLLRADLKVCREIEYVANTVPALQSRLPVAESKSRKEVLSTAGAAGHKVTAIKNGSALLASLRQLAQPNLTGVDLGARVAAVERV